MKILRKPFVVFLCLLWLSPLPVSAVQQLVFNLDALGGESLRAEGIELRLDAQSGLRFGVSARIRSLVLPATGERFEQVEFSCARAYLDGRRVRCDAGLLRLRHPLLGDAPMPVALDWDFVRERLSLKLKDVGLGGGRVALAVEADARRAALTLDAVKLDGAALAALMAHVQPSTAGWALAGSADLKLRAVLVDGVMKQGAAELQLDGIGFSDPAQGWLGDALGGRVAVDFRTDADGTRSGALTLNLAAGALLTPYAYLEATAAPMTLTGAFAVDAAGRELAVRELAFDYPGVVRLDARAQWDLDAGEPISLALHSGNTQAQALYARCLQPLLSGTLLEQVQWQGDFRLAFEQNRHAGPVLELALRGLGVADLAPAEARPRFSLTGLNGTVAWAQRQAANTDLSWTSAQLLGTLDVGAASLAAEAQGYGFRLRRPLDMPLMDGRLLVDEMVLRLEPEQAPALDFDAVLTPVSVAGLSRAFGWPPMSGSLSGVIPGLSLREGSVKLGGNLLVKVFDGDLVIGNLRLGDLLGPLPVLQADVKLKNLDLEALTGTFSFGKITGRVDGRVDALRMEGWRPVAFDAAFATPAGDDSSHAISQRAVDNISNLGGAGVGGSLSRGFLSMFEQFNYARLGISCRLENGTCSMGGVEPAQQGYYLVVGRGIPQINIVGFNTRTDWDTLVSQLQQISAGGSPVVEVGAGK